MTTFVEPPFWATRGRAGTSPHAVSVVRTPAITIVSSSIAVATVITTAAPHYCVSGDTVAILGHTGSTPAVDGSRVVTVISATTFSIPVTVTVAGAGGTATRTIAVEPLTVADAILRARLPASTDAGLMASCIAAARQKVQQDTELVPLLQTRDVYVDQIPGEILTLPAFCRPLQAVVSLSSIDTAGDTQLLDPATYVVDLVSGRIGLALDGAWPTDLRPFQPYVLRIVAGYPSIAALTAADPLLVHLIGTLAAHYATLGRDLASVEALTAVPFGYEDAIAPYRPVSLA